MSFSKARIQRFNELTSEAPPPGAYDPKFGSKIQGSIGKKIGRFNDAKSTTSSGAESNASVCSRSTSSITVKQFRTPQVPKKRVIVKPAGMSCPRAKTKLYNESKDPESKYKFEYELADLKVECENKNKMIQEYEKQIDDMKTDLHTLKTKFKTLQDEQSQIEKQHQKEIESMAQLQQEVMDNKNEKYQEEIQSLQSQLSFTLKTQEEEMYKNQKNEEELKAKINSLENKLSIQKEQDELINKMTKLEVATQKLDKMSEDLNDALNLKDLQVADLLKTHSETKQKLNSVEMELKKAEQQVADLEVNLESINNDNVISNSMTAINQQLITDMTMVLQEYFDYQNYERKWNVNNISLDSNVETFLKNIKKFATELKLTYEREIELSRDNFNEERENLEQELENKRSALTEIGCKLAETNETNAFLTEELQDVQKLYKDMSRNMQEIKNELELSNEKYTKTLTAHKTELELLTKIHLEEQTKLKNLLEESRNEYLEQLDNMTTARNEELLEVKLAMEKRIEDEKKRMKEGMNKMVENAEAVTRETLKACREESEERVRRIIAETDVLTREAKITSEEELRKVTEKYDTRLNLLENEKDALIIKLEQQDIEIIQLTTALEEMKSTAETQESFSQSLQAELDRAEAELMERKQELRNLKDQIRMESAEMVARRRRFEVVMSENQASVSALTRRLAQSESEVERLQRQLQSKIGSYTGYGSIFDTIAQDSKLVQEQLDSITDIVEEKVEFINQLEIKNVNEINIAKTTFNEKIENLKTVTIDELTKAQKECKVKSDQIIELKESLHQMSVRLSEATDMLLKLEEINDRQSIEMSQVQLQNSKLQQELDNKNIIIKEINHSFKTQLEYYKTEINEMVEQLSRLKKEIKILEDKKNEAQERKYDFEEFKLKYDDEIVVLSQLLETEKIERQKLEKQVKEYEQACERLTDECKQVSEKYTEAISNNNHKYRIKQISQLKEKINIQQVDSLRVRQEIDSKNDLVNEPYQTNEKLKFDELRQLGLGKENIHVISSPHKTLFPKSANSTPIASPHKPHTPLRDRND